MNITKYPSFRPIELGDKPLFDLALIEDPPQISEFTFTNIYAWKDPYKITISVLGNFLIVRSDGSGTPRFFTPVGGGSKKGAIERIIEETRGEFIRVPEAIASLFRDDDRFEIEPDDNDSDYLFKTQDLTRLAGTKYDGKRNLINKFKSAYKYEYAQLKGSGAEESLAFEEEWCSIKDCDGVEGLNNERLAIREMIANFSFFNLTGGVIKVDGKVSAIAIAERLNLETMVMHVMKADPNMAGLYQTMLNEFLLHNGKPFEYLNMEQDLGVEGLRKSKLSYHPVRMVKKYTLRAAR